MRPPTLGARPPRRTWGAPPNSPKLAALRLVLVLYAIGHLTTATIFLFWPAYFLDNTGPVPPWPASLIQFGTWSPPHQGFMAVLAIYDIAVAVALLLAAANPLRRVGVVLFALVLWTLLGAAHAVLILWKDVPPSYVWVVAELWVGVALLLYLFPRDVALPTAHAPA